MDVSCVYLEYGRPERLEAGGAVEDLQSRRHSTRPLELGGEFFSLLLRSVSFHLVGVRRLRGFHDLRRGTGNPDSKPPD
jgi:hypothetical protein